MEKSDSVCDNCFLLDDMYESEMSNAEVFAKSQSHWMRSRTETIGCSREDLEL